MSHEILRLAACRSVADADGLHAVLLDEVLHGQHRLYAFGSWRVREDDVVVQEIAFCIEAHHFASGAEARVNRHHTLLPKRRSHEQLLQVADEDADGFLVGFLLRRCSEFITDTRLKESLVAVLNSFLYGTAAFAMPPDKLPGNAFHCWFVVNTNRDTQNAFCLASPHSQQPMAGATLQGFLPVEVVAEVLPFGILAPDDFALYHGMEGEGRSQCLTGTLVFAYTFGDDILCPLQSFILTELSFEL